MPLGSDFYAVEFRTDISSILNDILQINRIQLILHTILVSNEKSL